MLLEDDEGGSHAIMQNTEGSDISVVVPVYNEEKSIGSVLTMLSQIDWYPHSVEIIVVDDGSKDNSAAVIESFPFVKFIRHPKNMGKGAALKTGFKKCTGRAVVVQDADMEYSPDSIPELVNPILEGKADVVFGSRFAGKYDGMSFSHYMGNRLLSLTARLLFEVPITDIMTGSKAFSREVVNSFNLQEPGFGVEVEMTSKSLQNGWKFTEVPIGYSYRTVGASKIRFTDGIKSLMQLFSSRL
jgi:glycosyltransferase involved in cell wall biosynthesis